MFNFKTLEIMKLQNLNLVELNAREVQEVEGGLNPYIGWVVAGLAWDICSNPKASYNAFVRGFNAEL